MHLRRHVSRPTRVGGMIAAAGLTVALAACGSQLTPAEVAAANGSGTGTVAGRAYQPSMRASQAESPRASRRVASAAAAGPGRALWRPLAARAAGDGIEVVAGVSAHAPTPLGA